MKSASIADIEARAPADGRPEDGRRIAFGKAVHDAAVRAPMSGWIVVDGHAVRTATLVLSGMVGALVLAVFVMGGYGQVWWAGLIALAGWPLLFVPRFVREDRRWRKERK